VSIDRTKVLESAQKLLAKGLLDKAIAEYKKLVDDDPKDSRTLLKIGDIYARKGDVQGACDVYFSVADQDADQGFFLKALAVYKQILKLDRKQIRALERLAQMYERLSLISDAYAAYEELLAAAEQIGDNKRIMDAQNRMVQLDPKNVSVCVNYAELLSKEGKTEEAAHLFESSAQMLKDQGNVEDYIKVAERLFFYRPEDLELARELAELYLERDEPKRALVKLQICFRADPKNTKTLELTGRGFLALGQTAKTLSVYKEMARQYAESGQIEQCRQTLIKICELDPTDEVSKNELAGISTSMPERISEIPIDSMPPRLDLESTSIAPEQEKEREEDDEDVSIGSDQSDVSEVENEEEIPVTFSSVPPTPPSRPSSAAPASVAAKVKRLMGECEVFLRYGLHDNVLSLIDRVLFLDPRCVEARKILKDLYIDSGKLSEATTQLFLLAAMEEDENPSAAADYLTEILEMDPANKRAQEELRELDISVRSAGSIKSKLIPIKKQSSLPALKDEKRDVLNSELQRDTSKPVLIKGAFSKTVEPAPVEELPDELVDILEEIDFYLDQQMVREARSTIEDALESFPDHPILLKKLRQLEVTDSGSEPAEEIREEESGSRGGDAEIIDGHYNSGVAYMGMELYDPAVREFEQCVGDSRLNCKAHTMLGLCYLAKGDINEGIRKFEEGLLSPDLSEDEEIALHFELGNAYELLKDYDAAQMYFQKVARKNPSFRDIKRRVSQNPEPLEKKDVADELEQLFDDIIIKE
jgi:tetratricopeptide (TPR) repeat protein